MNIAEQYISDAISGKVVVGESIKLACQNHLDDLDRQDDDDFPFYFDEDAAEKAVHFMTLQKHAKGVMRGKPFTLQGWQAAPVWCVFGWKRKDNDLRRYRKLYIKVARKNGKTEYASAIGNYGFFGEGEIDPEVYWVATKKDQAKIGWKRQKLMIGLLQKDSPQLRQYCKLAAHRVYTYEGDGFVAYLGQDSDTEDGTNPYYAIIDEYHAHKNNGMLDVVTSGMGGRMQPLIVIITTAGFNPFSPCAQFEKTGKQSLRKQIELENVFFWIYDLDDDDDWEDPSVWPKANPNLDVSVFLHNLKEEFKTAKAHGGTYETNFKTKHLNKWVGAADTWIQDSVWLKNYEKIDLESLQGRECYGGLDLASVRDLCSLCLFFPARPGKNERHVALFWHFVNETQAKERQKNDAVPYLTWADEGWLTLTEGNITDHKYIRTTMEELMEKYNILSVAYDRKMSAHLIPDLEDLGIRMEPYSQQMMSMSPPVKELERILYEHKLNHLNSPVMRWQMSNVAIIIDSNENKKPDKGKSSDKIDGVVAKIMAIGEWMTNREDDTSVYDKRDMRVL